MRRVAPRQNQSYKQPHRRPNGAIAWQERRFGVNRYELGLRTPSDDQLDTMAQAMGVAPEALRDIRVESARETLEVLFRMEEEIGLYPVENDGAMGHAIDSEKALAPATHQSLVAWKRMRDGLSDGSVSSEEYEICKASSFRG